MAQTGQFAVNRHTLSKLLWTTLGTFFNMWISCLRCVVLSHTN